MSQKGEIGGVGEPTAQMMPKLRKVWVERGDNFKQLHGQNEGPSPLFVSE